MAEKLDKVLNEVLAEQTSRLPSPGAFVMDIAPDVRDRAEVNQTKERLFPSFSHVPNMDADAEPADKVLIQIQHHFINGEFDKANELIRTFQNMREGTFFSWHHMNQLIDWVRNIYKYTNMKDISKNYYDYEMAKDVEIAGVNDLRKVSVKEATIDKFIKEAEKVLAKKLQMK